MRPGVVHDLRTELDPRKPRGQRQRAALPGTHGPRVRRANRTARRRAHHIVPRHEISRAVNEHRVIDSVHARVRVAAARRIEAAGRAATRGATAVHSGAPAPVIDVKEEGAIGAQHGHLRRSGCVRKCAFANALRLNLRRARARARARGRVCAPLQFAVGYRENRSGAARCSQQRRARRRA